MVIVMAWLPVLAAIVGLLLYALATNPRAMEIGRLLFFAGLFTWLLHTGGK